jgi:hypothetical protein
MVLYVQWLVELLLLVVAIVARLKRRGPKYLQNFYWYPLVLISSLGVYYLTFFKLLDGQIFIMLNNLLMLFHFTFLGYTIIQLLDKSGKTNWMRFLFISIVVLMIPIIYFKLREFPYASIPFAISNLGLIVFSGYYFFKLFSEFKETDPLQLPSVWLVLGIFVFGIFVIPGSLFDVYIKEKGSKEAYFMIYYVFQFAYFLRHFCFLRAYYLGFKLG